MPQQSRACTRLYVDGSTAPPHDPVSAKAGSKSRRKHSGKNNLIYTPATGSLEKWPRSAPSDLVQVSFMPADGHPIETPRDP
jgi:hypothetical protein